MLVIDSHTHLNEQDPAAHAHVRKAFMQEMEISHLVVQPGFHYSTVQGEASVRALNDSVAVYVREQDFAVAGFGIVDVHALSDPAAEAERVICDLGLVGISVHSRFQGTVSNDPLIMAAIDACPPQTRAIGVHCVSESTLEAPWRLEVLLDEFPQRTFIAMSALMGNTHNGGMIELCRRHSNVYLDTSGIIPLGRWVEKVVNAIGAERLLLGTDMYMEPPRYTYNYALQTVMTADISDDDKERIISRNAVELFGIDL